VRAQGGVGGAGDVVVLAALTESLVVHVITKVRRHGGAVEGQMLWRCCRHEKDLKNSIAWCPRMRGGSCVRGLDASVRNVEGV
jgi:hypothetical protein